MIFTLNMKINSLADSWRNIICCNTEIRSHVLSPDPMYLQRISAPHIHGSLLMMIGSDPDLTPALAPPHNLGTRHAICVTREAGRVLVLACGHVTGSAVGVYIRRDEDAEPRGLGGHRVRVDLAHVQTAVISRH